MHALGVQEFTVLPQTFATFSCAMSQCKEHGHCHVSPRLIELSAIIPNCFMLSRETIFTEVLPIQLEDLPLFKSIVYSMLGVRKLVSKQWCQYTSHQQENFLLQNELCLLTFIQCPFHPYVTAVASKRPLSFCQKCGWQVTPEHAYTLDTTKSEWADYAAVQA